MKLFDPPLITLIWLAFGTIFWIIFGIVTLNEQGETWKVMLQFALAAACLLGVMAHSQRSEKLESDGR